MFNSPGSVRYLFIFLLLTCPTILPGAPGFYSAHCQVVISWVNRHGQNQETFIHHGLLSVCHVFFIVASVERQRRQESQGVTCSKGLTGLEIEPEDLLPSIRAYSGTVCLNHSANAACFPSQHFLFRPRLHKCGSFFSYKLTEISDAKVDII